MKRLILFAAACSIITNAYSQNITGKIVDEQNVPLSYANVVRSRFLIQLSFQDYQRREWGIFRIKAYGKR